MFDFFKKQTDKKETKQEERFVPQQNMETNYKRVFRNSELADNMFDILETSSYLSNRKRLMTKNMDKLIDVVKEETSKQPYLIRTIFNMNSKVSKTNFKFVGNSKDKVVKVALEFQKILKNSNYNETIFFNELLSNLVKYSNSFLIPFRNVKTNNLEELIIIQNKGWTVHESIGTGYAKTYLFKDSDVAKKKYKKNKDVFHFTFNKETDEIFGFPIWIQVIPYLKKYNYLISTTLNSYSKQASERTLYDIGGSTNGKRIPVKQEVFNMISKMLEDTDQDMATDIPIMATTVKKEFKTPDKLLDGLLEQIIAGLFTTKSQLGSISAGRQDAESQNQNTLMSAEDFLVSLELQINQTIIKEICMNLFGNNLGENCVELKFENSFDTKERVEKHSVFLFQGGLIDIDEARKMIGKEEKSIDDKKTFFSLYQQKEMNGTVSSANNPSNQYTSGTGTTKKTKKD